MPSPTSHAIGIISLGCAKNLVDTEHMGARLRNAGYRFTDDIKQADILLVNTCGFIRDASQESIDTILEAASMKTDGQCRFLIVTGCLVQRHAGELAAELPEVDCFLGLDQLDDIVTRIDQWRTGQTDMPKPGGGASNRLFEPPAGRRPLTGGPFAYVKIAEGCHHRCAFCAIPMIRGRYRSRAIASIHAEVEDLLANGVREINLVAQDSTAYGRDRHDGAALPQLIRTLGRIGGDFWIRILYGFPSLISDDLLDAIAETHQVCRYLDVPIQHSDPDVLRRMGRASTLRAVHRLADRARTRLPDVTLRTTCLVGHPGETQDAFTALRDFLEAADFNHLGVFAFSPEAGTRSATQSADVSESIAQTRLDLLMRDQHRRVLKRHKNRVGQIDRILVEQQESKHNTGQTVGRGMHQAPEVDGIVDLHARRKPPRPGTFVNVRYTHARDYDLEADIL